LPFEELPFEELLLALLALGFDLATGLGAAFGFAGACVVGELLA